MDIKARKSALGASNTVKNMNMEIQILNTYLSSLTWRITILKVKCSMILVAKKLITSESRMLIRSD